MELLTAYAGELKSDATGSIKGYLIRFGSPNDTDLERDYFTKDTDFGFPTSASGVPLNLYYHHGMDESVGKSVIGSGIVFRDDVGLWMEAQIDLATEYGKQIAKLAKMGILGYSSGSAPHLVERKKSITGASEILRWPIAEASVTPSPAEYRNMVKGLGSMMAEYENEEYGEHEEFMPELEPTADPTQYASTAFENLDVALAHETVEMLYERFCMALAELSDFTTDPKPYIIALVDQYSKQMKEKLSAIPKKSVLESMRFTDLAKTGSVRETENLLREAVGLSRKQAKCLAPIIWQNLRDAEPESKLDQSTKTTESTTLDESARLDLMIRIARMK